MSTIRKQRIRGGPKMTCQVTEIDATNNLRTLVGRACPYDTWTFRGWYNMALAAGCFDKSIKEAAKSLPLLLFHDQERLPIGRTSKWESKSDGLWGEWELADDPQAQAAARSARQGMLTGLSVGFTPILNDWEFADREEWEIVDVNDLDRCTVREGRLAETSLTPTPSFVDAYVTHVAARREDSPTPHWDRWRRWRDSLTA